MSAGIPFQTDLPGETRGPSATTVPAMSRLGSANQDLISGSQYGSRAGSAISAKSEAVSRVASATSAGSRVSSAGSVFNPSAEGSKLGSAVRSRPASNISGSAVPAFSTSTTPTGQGAIPTSESPAPLPLSGYQNSGFIED